MEKFSMILKAWIKHSGKTQKTIANAMGFTKQTISMYIYGLVASPRLITVEKFAHAFGVSIHKFLAGPDNEFIESTENLKK